MAQNMEDSNWPTNDNWLIDVCNLLGWRDQPQIPNSSCQLYSLNTPEKPVFVGSWGRFHDCSSCCQNITYELVCKVSEERDITLSDVIRSFPTYLYQLKLRLLSSRLVGELFLTCSHAIKVYGVLILDNHLKSGPTLKRAKIAPKKLQNVELLDFLVYDVHKLHGSRALEVLHMLQELASVSYEEYVIFKKQGSERLAHLLAQFKTYCHKVLYNDTNIVSDRSTSEPTDSLSSSRNGCRDTSVKPTTSVVSVEPIFQNQSRVVKTHYLIGGREDETEAKARLARKQEVVDQVDNSHSGTPPSVYIPSSLEELAEKDVDHGATRKLIFPVSRLLLQITRNLFFPYKNLL